MSPKIIGHETQRSRLKRLCSSGRLATSTMLAGSAGIGKTLVAKELLRSLFCEAAPRTPESTTPAGKIPPYGGCNKCRSCRLFELGNLPDFYQVDCADKEQGSVEGLRRLLFSLNLKSFSGTARAVLFNNSEDLSQQAANLLLKALEEPRPGTYFLLICTNPWRLPPTLLSRCQVWFFDSLSQTDIKSILAQNPDLLKSLETEITDEDLALIADGSMAGITALAANLPFWRGLGEVMPEIQGGSAAAALRFAQELGKDKELLRERLRLLRIYARRELHSAQELSEQARWAVLLTNLLSAERLVFERYLGVVQVLANTFLPWAVSAKAPAFTRLPNSATLLQNLTV